MGAVPDSSTGSKTTQFLRNGALDGWPSFVDHYGRTIRRWCHRWRLGENEADELAQTIIVKLFEKMHDPSRCFYDPAKGPFHAWLKTVARNAWNDVCNQRQRSPMVGGKEYEEFITGKAAGDDFVKTMIEQELIEAAKEATKKKVTVVQWEAYLLKKDDGLSSKEVAERLGMKPATIDNYVSTVRKIFEQEMKDLNDADAKVTERGT
jgi:RNA polymerase sigma factor (sigma-70 family)